MNINLRHQHLSLSDGQISYIEEKIRHLEKYSERVSDESTSVDIDVESSKNKTSGYNISFQVTMFVPRAVIRAEVCGATVTEACDLAVEKLKRQIERYKGKQHRRNKEGRWIPSSTLESISEVQDSEYVDVVKVTKRKKFASGASMYEDEALEQLELLGHSFFVFKNIDTGLYNVVYKRDDGTYGLIELVEN